MILKLFQHLHFISKNLIFCHFLKWPWFVDFNDTSKYGIAGIRNIYIRTNADVELGTWHILPISLADKVTDRTEFDNTFKSGESIIIYFHGNAGTRAQSRLIDLYKLLQKMNFHIVAFDYRNYGDSTVAASLEEDVVEDAKAVIRWVLSRKSPEVAVYLWGHSLGSAISSRSAFDLEKEGILLDGLILEAPFNNIKEAIREYPISKICKYIPHFDDIFVEPVTKNGISFKTDENLSKTNIRILIVHAEDDWIIPYTLGKKLYDYLLKNRTGAEETVKYVQFSADCKYGHMNIHSCPDLPRIIENFVSNRMDLINSKVMQREILQHTN